MLRALVPRMGLENLDIPQVLLSSHGESELTLACFRSLASFTPPRAFPFKSLKEAGIGPRTRDKARPTPQGIRPQSHKNSLRPNDSKANEADAHRLTESI
ncbi:unnamed protein product [Phytomonas sp. Hart1]|nr:unnamed protein product [Phytomonas sp. Hart1]|eukprot:CCW70775.1 unnamed protein product [Phytomonas sp. isolate Hart1]